MWYFASVFWLWFILAAATVIGAALTGFCLPWRRRPAAAEFLAPTFGLGVLLVPVTALGWLGHGFRWWLCLPLTVGLAALAQWQRRRSGGASWRADRRAGGRLAGFSLLASFPILGQLLVYNTFNPFNDTWTYLYHAQWLQRHGFLEPAVSSGYHPAALAVLGFQQTGLRIVPSLLLGWLQAMFGLDWSYKIYPAAISLALVCGSLAVGGIARAAFPSRRREAWWVALAAAVTLNGFTFGALAGLIPQTLGLAFSTAALAVRSLELSACRPRGGGAKPPNPRGSWPGWRTALPLSGSVAGVAYCYPELLPFLVPTLAVSYALPWPENRAAWRARAVTTGWMVLLTSLLVNLEAARVLQAIKLQSHTVAGHPVALSVVGFAAQSLGLKSGASEGANWFYKVGVGALLEGLVPVACFGLLLVWAGRCRTPSAPSSGRSGPQTREWLALVPPILMTGLLAAAFLYFRYGVPNPWPHGAGSLPPGVGQSFNQLKLSLWAGPAFLASAGGALFLLLGRWRWLVRGSSLQWLLAAWCALGLGWNARLLLAWTAPIRVISGEPQDPFGSYVAFCAPLDDLPPDDVIYLEAAAGDFPAIKQRELLAYFLGDRPIIGDWTVDDNLSVSLLPPAERNLPVRAAKWIVRYQPPAADPLGETTPTVCRLTVEPVTPPERWKLVSTTGGYDLEHEADGRWFYWTKHELRLTWHERTAATGASAQRTRLSFERRSFVADQSLTVRITGTTEGDRVFTVPATLGNTRFETPSFVVAGNEVQVSFVGTGEPHRASATDVRELSYQVASAKLEPVPAP